MRRSSGSTAPASSPTAARLDTRAAFEAASGGKRELSRQKFEALLTASPAARRLELTARMITDFVGGVGAAAAASPRSPAARGADRLPPIEGSILSPLTRPAGRPTARSPSPEGKGAILRYSYDEYCDALERLPAFAEAVFSGVAIVGNGRSVLGQTAGPAIDKFKTIVRFNDYAISEYEEHVGCKTTLWVLSDWTCVKLLNKYPERSLPVLVAIPFKFMGKPYYHARRAELEEQLTAAQLSRITFVKADLAREIIEKYHFGDRWPSSGVITIWHILRAQPRVHLHGFDFFKQIVRRARAILSTFARNAFPSPRNSLTFRAVPPPLSRTARFTTWRTRTRRTTTARRKSASVWTSSPRGASPSSAERSRNGWPERAAAGGVGVGRVGRGKRARTTERCGAKRARVAHAEAPAPPRGGSRRHRDQRDRTR